VVTKPEVAKASSGRSSDGSRRVARRFKHDGMVGKVDRPHGCIWSGAGRLREAGVEAVRREVVSIYD